ncbi:UNVERIFIED_CONTAM: hypothetical protein NCL1_08325 [Trichonephila clavipes]
MPFNQWTNLFFLIRQYGRKQFATRTGKRDSRISKINNFSLSCTSAVTSGVIIEICSLNIGFTLSIWFLYLFLR